MKQIPSVSSLSNIVSSMTSPSPPFPLDHLNTLDDKERTPLLPIEQTGIEMNQQQISESPLTFGKKNSYGLFLPHSYKSPAPVQAMLGDMPYDEEEGSI